MKRGKRGATVPYTLRIEPALKAQVAAEARTDYRSAAEFGSLRFEWLMQKSADLGSFDELRSIISAAESFKPMADVEKRNISQQLELLESILKDLEPIAAAEERNLTDICRMAVRQFASTRPKLSHSKGA